MPTSRGFRFVFHALSLAAFLNLGCGSSSPGTNQPQPSSPFNAGAGEGNLGGNPSTTTYSSSGLDAFFTLAVCPQNFDCSTNTASLKTAQFGSFDLSAHPIANNPLGIQMVDGVKIHYTALNVDQSAVMVSGGIAVPETAASSIKGLILYYHGTTTQRTNVPSVFAATTDTDHVTDGTLLAAIWASQGYVVVMPDYIGLGDDTTEPHPYVVYPKVNAESGLAMVKAARALLSSSYKITASLPLYITGYSEGGAYALTAGSLMQNNAGYATALNLQLARVAPVSGFFDLSQTGLSYLFDNISDANNQWYSLDPNTSSLSKPFLTAYLTLAFAHYSGVSPTDVLANNFYVSNCATQGTACGTLDDVYFSDSQYAGYDAIVLSTAVYHGLATGWSSQPPSYSNAITPLLTPAYAQALMQKDATNPLYKQVVSADTYEFVPQFPVTLVSLQQDSVVTRKNSDVAFAYFTQHEANGPYQEILVPNQDFTVPGTLGPSEVDHTSELPFLSVLLLNEFNSPQ